jgi:hypothetical protein
MIPLSAVKPGMFFIARSSALYYVTRLKANGKPEICKMLFGEVRWLPPQTAYGVNKAEFNSPDALVTPVNNEQALAWNHSRFVRATQALIENSDQSTLRKLVAKATAPAVHRLKEIGAPEAWANTQLHKSLRGGPESVKETTNRLITEYQKVEQSERAVQALLAELHEAVQIEAGAAELELWDLFAHARTQFEFAQRNGISAEQRRAEIQGTKNGCLEWVRKQVAREKERRAA